MALQWHMLLIPIGKKGSSSSPVTNDVTVTFLGLADAHVLGTAALILSLEFVARDLVKPFLDEGFDTVGTHVDVRHLAATPIGMKVVYHAEVISADDRRIRFKVEAFDEKEQIADGLHERAIVNVARFAAKLHAKANG